jgi:hypothetical protein
MGPVIKLVYRLAAPPFDPGAGVEAVYARGTPPMWWTSSPAGAERPSGPVRLRRGRRRPAAAARPRPTRSGAAKR